MVLLSDGTSIGIGQDITQRKRAEIAMGEHTTHVEWRNLRMEQAMRESDHRVKNSLQAVAALLDMQVMAYDGPGFSQMFSPLTSAHFGLELVESVGRLDLGGRTIYENRPDGGACVRVTLPLPGMPPTMSS